MVNYVAFEGSVRLDKNSYQVIKNFEAGAIAPQNQLMMDVSNDFIDELLEAYMLVPMSLTNVNKLNDSIVRQLAALVSKTTKTLVSALLKKRTNAEMLPLKDYIKERRLSINMDGVDKTMIAIPISDELTQKFQILFADIKDGKVAESRPGMEVAMLEFSLHALKRFYKDPTDLLDLGRISRKMVDVGYKTMQKGMDSSIRKLFANQSDEELDSFGRYFETMFYTVNVAELQRECV